MLEPVNLIYLPISSFFIRNNTKHNPIENPVIDGTKILNEYPHVYQPANRLRAGKLNLNKIIQNEHFNISKRLP
jgi:hypothetical protein